MESDWRMAGAIFCCRRLPDAQASVGGGEARGTTERGAEEMLKLGWEMTPVLRQGFISSEGDRFQDFRLRNPPQVRIKYCSETLQGFWIWNDRKFATQFKQLRFVWHFVCPGKRDMSRAAGVAEGSQCSAADGPAKG